MLTKKTVTTNFYEIDLPNLKGKLTEQEAIDLLDALVEALSVETEEAVDGETADLFVEEEAFEEDAELQEAQN